MNYLVTITLPNINSALVVSCFNVLFGCVKTANGSAVITQGSEQLAAVSVLCCLHMLSHLALSYITPYTATIDLTPMDLEGIRQRYARVLQSETNFNGLPFSHALGVIYRVFYPSLMGRMGFPANSCKVTLYTRSAQQVQRVR